MMRLDTKEKRLEARKFYFKEGATARLIPFLDLTKKAYSGVYSPAEGRKESLTIFEIIERTIQSEIICSTRIAKIMATAILDALEKEGFEVTEGYFAVKRTPISYCQVCQRDFISPELVYFAPIDNTIICSKCSEVHRDRRLRIYVKEE